MSTTPEELVRPGWITARECAAIRLLHEDGRGVRELAFLLEHKAETVGHHINGECRHGHVDRVDATEEVRHV